MGKLKITRKLRVKILKKSYVGILDVAKTMNTLHLRFTFVNFPKSLHKQVQGAN